MRSFDTDYERVSVVVAAARLLALQIRETAHANGQLDQLIDNVYIKLAEFTEDAQ